MVHICEYSALADYPAAPSAGKVGKKLIVLQVVPVVLSTDIAGIPIQDMQADHESVADQAASVSPTTTALP